MPMPFGLVVGFKRARKRVNDLFPNPDTFIVAKIQE